MGIRDAGYEMRDIRYGIVDGNFTRKVDAVDECRPSRISNPVSEYFPRIEYAFRVKRFLDSPHHIQIRFTHGD